MTSDFRVIAAPLKEFSHLFSLSDVELAERGARRMTVDTSPGYPCRVSLVDAAVGEEVILTPFVHHDADSPYRSSGPVFVREAAREVAPRANEIPELLRQRELSVRAYDRDGMMVDARVVEGRKLEDCIHSSFESEDVSYLHIHNAGPGCFNCAVERA